jgi:hypothetical protein
VEEVSVIPVCVYSEECDYVKVKPTLSIVRSIMSSLDPFEHNFEHKSSDNVNFASTPPRVNGISIQFAACKKG